MEEKNLTSIIENAVKQKTGTENVSINGKETLSLILGITKNKAHRILGEPAELTAKQIETICESFAIKPFTILSLIPNYKELYTQAEIESFQMIEDYYNTLSPQQ